MQIVKNKCAAPYKLAEFDILFGSGISSEGCTLDAAEAVGVIVRKGSWYRCGTHRPAMIHQVQTETCSHALCAAEASSLERSAGTGADLRT